jgi:hypothetical protein
MKKLNERAENALSGIEIAMMEINARDRREGEFTVDDFILALADDGQVISYQAASKKLRKMAKDGLLKSRLIPLTGNLTRVYSKP